jgi:hypothetical protein
MLDIMTAYCGLACNSCPIHLATLEQDKILQKTMRAEIARQCSDIYKMKMTVEEVTDCDGCRANDGRLFSGCLKCLIRNCTHAKNIESCAFCEDFTCEKLIYHFLLDPEAKVRLEKIRQENLNK